MLINTVLLFLQNALPIFIVSSLLLLQFPLNKLNMYSVKWFMLTLIIITISTLLLSQNLSYLSQQFDGKGLELFLALVSVLIYLFVAGLFMFNEQNNSRIKANLGFIILLLITSVKGAYFIAYLSNYWSQAQHFEAMFLGIILGGGICVSIAILFYFSLSFINNNLAKNCSNYFILLFAIGQLMHAVVLLQQVDILSSGQQLWDSGHLIAENSEVGQLLTVLFGYETTPSTIHLITFLIAFVIPITLRKIKQLLLSANGAQS